MTARMTGWHLQTRNISDQNIYQLSLIISVNYRDVVAEYSYIVNICTYRTSYLI